jgi:hypothetical protein
MASVNDMVVHQASTVLNSLVKQATGQAVITASTPGEFVSVAQTALKTGYEPILNAMSQMWGRTIFSIRPYTRKFKGMEMSLDRWGNARRKISVAEQPVKDDERFTYPAGYDATQDPANGNGKSVDMFKLNKPDILQTNFYGQSVYENIYTVFRDNLDVAFTGPDEFMRFNSMVAQNRSDKLEQYRETIARGLLVNYIASILEEGQNDRIIHLLTEYNALTGLKLTAQSVYQPANFQSFMEFVYSRIANISRMMTERSEMFQTVINEKHIMRHTPPNRQKVYLYSKALDMFDAMVKANTFHDNYLKYTDYEGVNFWQSIETPDRISATATYTKTDGTVATGAANKEQAGIFGVIFDEDALGYAQVNAWNSLTPFNPVGGYWNDVDHVNFRTLMDMTEKGVLLLLD